MSRPFKTDKEMSINCVVCGKSRRLRSIWYKKLIKTCSSKECISAMRKKSMDDAHKNPAYNKMLSEKWTGSKNPRFNPNKDIHKKIRKFCYQSVYRVLLKYGKDKPCKTFEMLGYNSNQLKLHIESKFTNGMNWENRSKWDIDHIIPIDHFLKKGITDLSIINSLGNLRPLWREENRKKANYITGSVS